ncbi:MAG: galactokinase [Erysipelotrichaceae bacterium]
MRSDLLKQRIAEGRYDDIFIDLYNDQASLSYQKQRYIRAIEKYEATFSVDNVAVFSVSGRTEIAGNHSDHQKGKGLASAVNLDVIAVCATARNGLIKINSNDRKMPLININQIDYDSRDYHNSKGLVKGVLKAMDNDFYRLGGFNAYLTSDIIIGSGLSSSAAFEVMIATIINGLYNRMEISPIDIAKYCRYAENVYFGKASGLMDQLSCSIGNLISFDFSDENNPKVEKINYDFDKSGYSLCIVDCKGSHSKMMDEFNGIIDDLKTVAQYFGKQYISEVSQNEILDNISQLRQQVSDRSIIRSLHILSENERAAVEANALKNNDIELFIKTVKQSGDSSFKYLQNIYSEHDTSSQSLSIALMISEMVLKDNGVCKVHGGGFGGTIQTFVKNEFVQQYKQEIEKVFGENSCHILKIRKYGAKQVFQ